MDLDWSDLDWNAIEKIYGIDPAKVGADMAVKTISIGRGAYQITGKKPHFIIIDDIVKTK